MRWPRKGVDSRALSDNSVSMKTITSRQLSRKPSLISAIKPGETVRVPDRQGGLLLTRKKSAVSAEEMFAELDKLAAQCPPMDTKAFLDEGE
jgi:hypothetical protein